jgi:general secretion pathway protein D
VLIEAKVLEVSLNDQSSEGIDWSALPKIGRLYGNSDALNLSFGTGAGLARSVLSPEPAPSSNFHLGYAGHDAHAFIDAISQFGTVHALASPRLTVLNNQSAVLNVADNLVYFTVKIDTTIGTNGAGNTVTVDSQAHNVPEGVLINVQPSINLQDQTISMAVRPTITRKISSVDDPAAAFESALAGLATPIESSVPVMNVQELDSVVQVHSGDALVMGGLMQDRAQATDVGVPVLSEVPLVGALFKNKSDTITKTELVVFLKATIVNGDTLHQTDKDLYKEFGADRRPLDM